MARFQPIESSDLFSKKRHLSVIHVNILLLLSLKFRRNAAAGFPRYEWALAKPSKCSKTNTETCEHGLLTTELKCFNDRLISICLATANQNQSIKVKLGASSLTFCLQSLGKVAPWMWLAETCGDPWVWQKPLCHPEAQPQSNLSALSLCVCEFGHVVFIGTVRLHEAWVYKLPSKEVLQLYKRGPGLTVFWVSGCRPKIKLNMETAFCFKTRFQRKLCCLLSQLGTCVDNWDPLQGANDHWIVAFCISSWAQKIPVWSSKPSALGDFWLEPFMGVRWSIYLDIFIYIYISLSLSIYLSLSLSLPLSLSLSIFLSI